MSQTHVSRQTPAGWSVQAPSQASVPSFIIDIDCVMPRQVRERVRAGVLGWSKIAFQRADNTRVDMLIRFDIDKVQGRAELWFSLDEGGERKQIVALQTTRSTFGRPWWWTCPGSGIRCKTLFLPIGGMRFLSASAYELRYGPLKMPDPHRMALARLYARLNSPYIAGDMSNPARPVGMPIPVYNRLIVRIERLRDLCTGEAGFRLKR